MIVFQQRSYCPQLWTVCHFLFLAVFHIDDPFPVDTNFHAFRLAVPVHSRSCLYLGRRRRILSCLPLTSRRPEARPCAPPARSCGDICEEEELSKFSQRRKKKSPFSQRETRIQTRAVKIFQVSSQRNIACFVFFFYLGSGGME